jgi:hypothetical protein
MAQRKLAFLIASLLACAAMPALAAGAGNGSGGSASSGMGSSSPAGATNTGISTPAGQTSGSSQGTKATQPSASPFQNPVGQGVPPAATANDARGIMGKPSDKPVRASGSTTAEWAHPPTGCRSEAAAPAQVRRNRLSTPAPDSLTSAPCWQLRI